MKCQKKHLTLALALLAVIMALSSCKIPEGADGDSEPEWTKGTYQSTFVEGEREWLEVLVAGEAQKFLIRDEATEYAAIPDFIQRGDEIGLYYTYNSDKEMVAKEITSPDLFD